MLDYGGLYSVQGLIMPAWIISFFGGMVGSVGTIVSRALISLGIGYVTYLGLSTSLDYAYTQVAASFDGLPADALAVLSALRLGEGVSVLFGALATKLAMKMVGGSGSIRKMVLK